MHDIAKGIFEYDKVNRMNARRHAAAIYVREWDYQALQQKEESIEVVTDVLVVKRKGELRTSSTATARCQDVTW